MKQFTIAFALLATGLIAGCQAPPAGKPSADPVEKNVRLKIEAFLLSQFPLPGQAVGNEPTRDMVRIDEIIPLAGLKNYYAASTHYYPQGEVDVLRIQNGKIEVIGGYSSQAVTPYKLLSYYDANYSERTILMIKLNIHGNNWWSTYHIKSDPPSMVKLSRYTEVKEEK